MKFPILDPRDLATVWPRVLRIVGEAERLLTVVGATLARIEATRTAAQDVITRVDATAARADALVVLIEPAVVRLIPALEVLAESLDPADVEGLADIVKAAPDMADQTQRLLPVLDSLATVAPDLNELLAASHQLNELLGGLPGMGRVKKRVEEAHQGESDEKP